MSVGNDVVDLGDPETRLEGLHPRFDERVFGQVEREALEASDSRHLLHWVYWAAKESAYKALKRLTPGAVFSPNEFEVDLSPLPAPGVSAVAAGFVLHRGRRFELEVRLEGASVHAVARTAGVPDARVLWKVDGAQGDPSVAVRRLATDEIGLSLGLDPVDLRIAHRPPVVTHRDRPLEIDVSLSHHGRFVAFACTMPTD